MGRECPEWFLCHQLQREPLVSNPGMHHGTCVTHVPWCMSGLLTRGGGENVPGIPGACATHNFTYLARDPWLSMSRLLPSPRHQWPFLLTWFIFNYSTGVQIVSCTLSDDSVLSESTGLFNPVLCVSQWNLFWQKNQPMRLCLSNQVRSAREWFPSPLGDFIRLFEGLIGELFQIWHWNMFYFFKWHQSGP